MRRIAMFLIMLAAISLAAPIPAWAQGRGGGRGGGGGGGGEPLTDELVVIFRDAAGDRMVSDGLGAYVDGQDVDAFLDAAGIVQIEAKKDRKKQFFRKFLLDFPATPAGLNPGDQVPFFAGAGLIAVSGRMDVVPDCAGTCPGTGNSNLPGGVAGVNIADTAAGPQPTRWALHFEHQGTKWRTVYQAPRYAAFGTAFADLVCTAEAAATVVDENGDPVCIAWTLHPAASNVAGLISEGTQPDGGAYVMPSAVAICRKGDEGINDAASCLAATGF